MWVNTLGYNRGYRSHDRYGDKSSDLYVSDLEPFALDLFRIEGVADLLTSDFIMPVPGKGRNAGEYWEREGF